MWRSETLLSRLYRGADSNGSAIRVRCFPLFNETSVLKLQIESCRMFEYIIIIESKVSHVGKPKPIIFWPDAYRNHPSTFIHVVLEEVDLNIPKDMDENSKAWWRDRYQKIIGLEKGVQRIRELYKNPTELTILASDCDEIIEYDKFESGVDILRQNSSSLVGFEMDKSKWYFRQFNITWPENWLSAALLFKLSSKETVQSRIQNPAHGKIDMSGHDRHNIIIPYYTHKIQDAGYHLSYFGEERQEKWHNFADWDGKQRDTGPRVTHKENPHSEIAAYGHGNKIWTDGPILPPACRSNPLICESLTVQPR